MLPPQFTQVKNGEIRMGDEKRLDVDRLTAIDMHVHIEHEGEDTSTDEAAKKYFGEGAPRGRRANGGLLPVEQYRLRRFHGGRKAVGQAASIQRHGSANLRLQNADIMMAFASIDPHRGAEGVREAKRLIATGLVRGFKLHPRSRSSFPNDRHGVSALRSARRGEAAGSSFTPATAASARACRAEAESG